MKKILLAAVVAVMALTGCNSSKNVVYMQDIPLNTPVEMQPEKKIHVRPGDMLSITVSCKDPQLAAIFNPVQVNSNQQSNSIGGPSSGSMVGANSSSTGQQTIPYTINSAGDIDFPVFGMIHVAGLTREQVADLIKNKIKNGGYIDDPKVNVTFMNLHVTVLGDVGSPGTKFFNNDKMTILEAIASSGDLTITGKRDAVYVTRTEGGKRTTTRVDLTTQELFNSPVFYLQQDDVIYVEPNGMRAGQSTVNENSFKSVGMWTSIASFLMSLSVLVFK